MPARLARGGAAHLSAEPKVGDRDQVVLVVQQWEAAAHPGDDCGFVQPVFEGSVAIAVDGVEAFAAAAETQIEARVEPRLW